MRLIQLLYMIRFHLILKKLVVWGYNAKKRMHLLVPTDKHYIYLHVGLLRKHTFSNSGGGYNSYRTDYILFPLRITYLYEY